MSNLDIKTRLDIGLNMNFGNPIRPPVDIRRFDKFGKRDLNYDGDFLDPGENHKGVDLRPKSDDILASHDGKVTFVGKDQFGGLYIDITNGNYRTRYLHNRQNLVKLGQNVKQGDLIGYIGSTGQSTGRHLHFEIWEKNVRIDPETKINFNQNNQEIIMFNNAFAGLTAGTQQLELPSEQKARLQGLLNTRDEKEMVEYYRLYAKELHDNTVGKVQGIKDQEIKQLKTELEIAYKSIQELQSKNQNYKENLLVLQEKPTVTTPIQNQAANNADNTVEVAQNQPTQKWDWIANEKWGVYTGSAMAFASMVLGVLVENVPELSKALEGETVATGGSLTGIALIILRSIHQIKKNKENAKTN